MAELCEVILPAVASGTSQFGVAFAGKRVVDRVRRVASSRAAAVRGTTADEPERRREADRCEAGVLGRVMRSAFA